MSESLYDVALWLSWPLECPEFVEDVQASGPLEAVWRLMQAHQLSLVAKAAVQLPNKSIERWYGVKLEVSPVAHVSQAGTETREAGASPGLHRREVN